MQDPGLLLSMMEQFSPQRQQAEQLQLQALAQQLAQGAAQEQRAQEQFLATQAQAQQLNPIEVQLRQAALAQIPQQQEAAQLAAEAARFGLGQQQALAPLAQQQLAAQVAAAQAAPQHQAQQLDLERQQLAQTGQHYTAQEAQAAETAKNTRLATVLGALQGGVPGIALDPSQLGQMSGGMLRPAGTQGALNQFLSAGDPTGGQQYLSEHPEVQVTPEMAKILATGATAGTQAPAGTSTVPGAGAQAPGGLSDFDRQKQLFDLQNLESHLSPQALGGVGGALQPLAWAGNFAQSRAGMLGDWLRAQVPTQESFSANIRKQREKLQQK